MSELVWKDEYNVGCDYVDKAHMNLVSKLRETVALCMEENYEKNKKACIDSINYLKEYTITHFSQEEAFMKQVGYEGFEIHKKLHDELRDETVPGFEKMLYDNDFSRETVLQFLGVFAGWLTSHILIEDQAITGKAISRFARQTSLSELDILKRDVDRVLFNYTGFKGKAIDEHYKGEEIGNAVYYEMEFDKHRVVFAAQKSLIFSVIGKMLGIEVTKMNQEILVTYLHMVHNLVRPAMVLYCLEDVDKQSRKNIIEPIELSNYFWGGKVKCSVKWLSEYGKFALCIFEK